MLNLISQVWIKLINRIEIMNSKFGICLLFLLFLVHSNDLVLSNEFFTNYFTDNDFNTWTMSGNNIPADHFFTQCGS